MRLVELQQLAPQLHELFARSGASLFCTVEQKSALEDLLLTRIDLILRRNFKQGLRSTVEAEAIPGLIQSVSQSFWPELPAWGLLGGDASSLCPKPPLPQLNLI